MAASGAKPEVKQLIHPDCDDPNKAIVPAATTTKATTTKATTPAATTPATTITVEEKIGKGFLFDIIVVRLDIPNKNVEDPSKIYLGVSFYNKNLTITSSRINVLDFKPESILEFYAKPINLQEELSKKPLRLKVIEGDKVLGYGKVEFPAEFLSALIGCTGELRHTAETELNECDGTKIGTIQIIVRLQPVCEEYVEDNSPDGKCLNAHKEIRPTDILFVVGEDKGNCCCAEVGIIPASDSDTDLGPKCLDLSNFRPVNSQNVNDVDILSSIDPACQKLKSFDNHYEMLTNALKSKGKTCDNDVLEGSKDPKNSAFDSNLFQIGSDSPIVCLNCDSESKAFTTTKNIRIPNIMTPPDLIENKPENLRCCPLCKENMTFLPKLAACPNCCYKPVPYFEEKSYNDDENAEQVIKEYQNDLEANDNANSNADISKCRCTCQYGLNKPCAHCRIRKLCENIFKPSSPDLAKPADVCEAKSSEVHCASSDSRPFLSKIFSELKDIYDIEEPKQKVMETDERCEKELNKMPIKKIEKKQPKLNNQIVRGQCNKVDQQKECTSPKKCIKRKKRCLKPAADKAVKSRLYDYETVRQRPTTNQGHKTCVNGFAGRKNVPPNMGWLWNVHQSGKWKPGAIRKPIKELMRYFLKDFPADTLLVSKYCYRKPAKDKNPYSNLPTLVQKPTLHIYKHDGEYIITMRPLKPVKLLKDAADPYEDMKPIQFRIVKNPKLNEIRKVKQFLKDIGFKKCTCHQPIMYCYCRSFLDKKKLEYQCNKECRKRQIEPCCSTLVLSDTSDSEAEFNFGVTPPAGVIKPERLIKVDVVNVSTQYNEIDWNPESLFPRPPNKYMQMYQCAIGERKGRRLYDGKEGTSGGINSGRLCIAGAKGTVAGAKTGGGGGGGDGRAFGFTGKYSGRSKKKNEVPAVPEKKVDMLKYALKAAKKSKISPAEAAAKRREKMKLLRGVNPPLLCMVDRLGKPANPCEPFYPCNDYRIC